MIALNIQFAEIDAEGAVICPICDACIITLPTMRLRAGTGTCPECNCKFKLDQKTADEANDRVERRWKS
jgi:uncharacterized Zn-finger protein